MNESKQITTENWQFSAVDSIQEFYLFIFLLLSCFLEGGGSNLLHGIYRVVPQKPRFKHYASCCFVFSALSAVCGVCSLTKWQDSSRNLFYSRYSLLIIFAATERFHPREQQLDKFLGTREKFHMRKKFNPHRMGLGRQLGRRLIDVGHQYGWPDFM